MLRRDKFVAFLLLILCSLSYNVVQGQDSSAVRLQIIDAKDKTPIQNVSVRVDYSDAKPGESIQILTNKMGEVVLRADSLSDVSITVTHPEYEKREISIKQAGDDPIIIELQRLSEETFFSGRITTLSGNRAVEGASIQLESINNVDVGGQIKTVSGSDGRFRFNFEVNPNISNNLRLAIEHPDFPPMLYRVELIRGKEHLIKIQPRKQSIRMAGKIVDEQTGNPIDLASVLVLPKAENSSLMQPVGTSADINGRFDFNFSYSAPFRLRFTHISYQPKEITINEPTFKELEIKMTPKTISGDELFIFSEIVEQDELENTGTVDKISSLDIQQLASMNAFDLVSTMREVDVSTQSMNLQSVSTRGFNSTANPRFLQLTDGVDNVAPGFGFPIGNLMGPSELDIASIELKVGASTSRYGSSALSGVLLTESKDPFLTEGVSVSAKAGMHNFKFGGAEAWAVEGEGVYDLSIRYAAFFNDKIAFKVNGAYVTGTDWTANNYDNISTVDLPPNISADPGYNGVNVYGDENFSFLPVGFDIQGNPNGSFTPVTRTGYREPDLVNYDIETRKLSASLQYKFSENTRFNVDGRYGYTNTLFTGDSRIRLQDFEMVQLKSEFRMGNFLVRGYTTKQYSGNSYNINTLSNQLITSAKSNSDWYRDFRIAYENGLPVYQVRPENVADAREFADSGVTLLHFREAERRLEPGTAEFNSAIDSLINMAGFDQGPGLRDNSQLYHAEALNNFEDIFAKTDLTAGGSFRFYDVQSQGTLFPDTTGNNITNYQYGGFIELEDRFLDEKLRAIFSVRLEKNENFDPLTSQQLGLNYAIHEKHYFRFSYQNGFRIPTLREQFLNTNVGDARLVGGLAKVNNPYDLAQNAFTTQSADDFNSAVFDDLDTGMRRPQAELNNLDILEQGILEQDGLNSIKPERTHSFELGYRQLINRNLYFDTNYFASLYSNFIGIRRFIKPRTSPSTDLFTAAEQINNVTESDQFYVFSNSRGLVTAQGVSFDVTYHSGNFTSSLNGTWTQLFKESDDSIIPGYNTPPFKLNFEWGNREIITNVGFKMNFRYRSAFDWKSSFLDGRVPSYGHFDFQFNIRFPSVRSALKFGVTNMGVSQHYDTFGGPAIGSILFANFTFTP